MLHVTCHSSSRSLFTQTFCIYVYRHVPFRLFYSLRRFFLVSLVCLFFYASCWLSCGDVIHLFFLSCKSIQSGSVGPCRWDFHLVDSISNVKFGHFCFLQWGFPALWSGGKQLLTWCSPKTFPLPTVGIFFILASNGRNAELISRSNRARVCVCVCVRRHVSLLATSISFAFLVFHFARVSLRWTERFGEKTFFPPFPSFIF